MKEKVSVFILSGLPGSGKTYFAISKKIECLLDNNRRDSEVQVIHFDDRFYQPEWFEYGRKELYLDGLFLTTDEIISVIKDCNKKAKYWHYDLEFTIIRWKEDRNKCLKNDLGRREKDSQITIKKAKFEEPDLEKIKEEIGVEVRLEEREIIEKNNKFENLSGNVKVHMKGKYLVSDSWIMSGTRRGYDYDWNSVYSIIDSEEPSEFDELYEFFETVCPQLTALDMRKIKKEFVTLREFEVNDYYSCTQEAEYICDIEAVMKFLEEKGYFEK